MGNQKWFPFFLKNIVYFYNSYLTNIFKNKNLWLTGTRYERNSRCVKNMFI